MKNKKVIFILAVLAILITLFIKYGLPAVRQRLKIGREKIREGQSTEMRLPENWEVSSESENELILTRQQENFDIQTKVVLLINEPEIDEFSGYLERLIQGAKQTLPSLRYEAETEIEQVDDWQMKELVGYYYSGREKINLIQRIYYQNGKLATITASYGQTNEEEIESELSDVFSFLKETYLEISS